VIPPSGPRSDHHILGSNLSDEEFKILLEVVGTSHDGKISLSEFDQIAKCSMINSSNGSKYGSSNNENNPNNKNKNNGLLASNSTYEYPNRGVDFDVLNYEKCDKNHKIDWDKVREMRRNSARKSSMYNTDQEQNTSSKSSNSAVYQYQSTERPHEMPRGRDLVPDSRARRSHSLNGLGSSRPQGIQASFRQGEIILIDFFEDERKALSDVLYYIIVNDVMLDYYFNTLIGYIHILLNRKQFQSN
jgi:hypothetical protein